MRPAITMTEDQNGIHLHATAKGKLMIVARKGGESVSFTLNLDQAEQLRDEYQRCLSEIQPEAGGRNHPAEIQE